MADPGQNRSGAGEVLRIAGLNAWYGESHVLHGVDLTVHKGEVVTCVVTAIQSNGIEVKVGDVLTGFIRRAELARDKSDQRPDRFAVGEKVDAKVIAVDRAARKLSLTIKGKEVEEEKQAMAEFGSSDSGASLGDILGAAIRRRNQQAQTDS